MKKIILSFFLLLITTFCFSETIISLDDFFDTTDYYTEKNKLDFAEIYYSYQKVENTNIYDVYVNKAIFYLIENNKIKPLLIIDNEKIYNLSEVLFTGTNNTKIIFYGYKIGFNKNSGNITTDYYTNGGKNVTDGPSFDLDKQTMKYHRYYIDLSEY